MVIVQKDPLGNCQEMKTLKSHDDSRRYDVRSHSFSSLSHDRSKASSKASSKHSAIVVISMKNGLLESPLKGHTNLDTMTRGRASIIQSVPGGMCQTSGECSLC